MMRKVDSIDQRRLEKDLENMQIQALTKVKEKFTDIKDLRMDLKIEPRM